MSLFPEAPELLIKAHEIGSHFSHGEKRYGESYSFESSTYGGVASVLAKLDINETRELFRHNLACSMTRLHKVLRHYFLGKKGNMSREELDLRNLPKQKPY